MKNILVLGTGRISPPLIRYLLTHPDYRVVIAALDICRAEAVIAGHANAKALVLDVEDKASVQKLVSESDIVVSLMPASFNALLARLAISARKNFINTSYVSPEMAALDAPARAAGVLLLCETGLDPGIDHMSVMRELDRIQHNGGTLVRLSSCCGGIPARESNTNPWGYKFSWLPHSVLLAGRSDSRYRRAGKTIRIPRSELFTRRWDFVVKGEGLFEIYPNRDALRYAEIYRVPRVQNVFRGTIRYPGWCETMTAVTRLGLLELEERDWPAGTTYAEFTTANLPSGSGSLVDRIAAFLDVSQDSDVMARLEWAGLLSDRPLPNARSAPIDVLGQRLQLLMAYKPGERDLVIQHHDIVARYPDGREEHIESLLRFAGTPFGDSAMAKTVALPAAMATDLLLRRGTDAVGVQIPVSRDLYQPILLRLEEQGIVFETHRRVLFADPFTNDGSREPSPQARAADDRGDLMDS